jgi:hypothetical protein
MAGFCEHGNEPSGSIKCGKFLDHMSVCYLLKKDCATWNMLFSFTVRSTDYERVSWRPRQVWSIAYLSNVRTQARVQNIVSELIINNVTLMCCMHLKIDSY